MSAPPQHVLAAFGIYRSDGVELSSNAGGTWRYDDVVVKPVLDPVEAAWSAGVFEAIRVTDVRVARPLRSSDGRWVVGGWSAQRFVSGRPAARYDDTIATSFAFHEALAALPRPRFLAHRRDLMSWADRLAWGEETDTDGVLGGGHGVELFGQLAKGCRPVRAQSQVIHGDLFGHVLFAGSAPPAVVDFLPMWRPAGYAAAIVAIDAVAWGGASADLVSRWSHVPEWGQLLRRAVLFRLAVSLAHPRTTPESLVDVLASVDVLRPLMDGGEDPSVEV